MPAAPGGFETPPASRWTGPLPPGDADEALDATWLVGSGAPTFPGSAREARPPAPPTMVRSVPPVPPPSSAGRQRFQSLWREHRRTLQVGAIVGVVLVCVAAVAVGVGRWILRSGPVLTVTRPEGGTVTGAGLNCGSRGSTCAVTLRNDEAVELQVAADAGFLFVGYTGDCAPAGRTTMAGPRTCGATFERESVQAATTQTLTIDPPTGGTVLGIDIKCGSQGTACSAALPNGVPVTLSAQADAGYAFGNFTGDCTPAGETQMTGPRTCGAVFRPSLPPGPPPGPGPSAAVRRPSAGGGGGGGAPPGGGAPTVVAPPTGPGPMPGTPSATVSPEPEVPPPIAPEVQAKNEIAKTLKAYVEAYKQLDVQAIRRVFPGVSPGLASQFKDVKSIASCTFGDPEYVELNAEAGTATMDVPWTLVQDMKVGGRQKTETVARVKMSRPAPRADWRIEGVTHRPK